MQSGVARIIGGGTLVAVFTAYAIALIGELLGFSPYGMTVILLIPIGALICGFVAMAGFFYLAKNQAGLTRPMPGLLASMILASCLAQFLIYWFQYVGAFLPGPSFSDFASFEEYIRYASSHADIYRRGMTFEDESGALVSAMSVAQAFGFIIASVISYKQLPGPGGFLEE